MTGTPPDPALKTDEPTPDEGKAPGFAAPADVVGQEAAATPPPSRKESGPQSLPDQAPGADGASGRLSLVDRIIPFLAAFVGLVALAGAVIVQLNADAGQAALRQELQRLQAEIETLSAEVTDGANAAGVAFASADAIAALEARLVALEAVPPTPQVTASNEAAQTEEPTPAEAEVEGPVTDCIPLGTRFMALPGESYPLCRTTSTVQVGSITADAVDVTGSGTIVANSFGKLAGTDCTIMVFSADAEGFAEMRVTCG